MRFFGSSLFAELWLYVRETRKIWFFLLVGFLCLLGLLIVLTESSAVMPFIYALF